MASFFPIPPEQRVIRIYTGRAEQPIRTIILTAAEEARLEIDLGVIAAILSGTADIPGGLTAALHVDTMIGKIAVDLQPYLSDLVFRAAAAGELVFAESMGVPELDLGLFRQEAAGLARTQVGDLITGISAGQLEAVRNLIAEGYELGRSPAATAQLIRDSVGLDARRAAALSKYQAELEDEGRPADQVARMVERERRRKLLSRGNTIAATETIRAASEAQDLIWEDGVREGQIDGNVWEQEWVPVPGACAKICLPLKGARAPIGGLFPGGRKGPPAHPRCRCARRLRRR